MNPPLRTERRPRRADRRARTTARSRRSRPTTRRTRARRRTCRSRRRRSASPASRRRSRRSTRTSSSRAWCALETLLERMSAGPGAHLRARAAARSPSARRRTSSCSTTRRPGACARSGFRSRSANSWLLGSGTAATGAGRVRRMTVGRPGTASAVRGMTRREPFLASCEDGERSFVAGRERSARARRLGRVRRGRLHDRDDRLPGGRHRPELLRADRLLHRADGRQLRRRRRTAPSRRGRTRAAVVMREARGPEWTDWLHERGIPALTGDRHARARRCTCASGARCAAPSSPAASDVDEALAAVRGQPSMSRRRARRARLDRASRTSTATAGAVRVAVVDYGAKRSILRRLAAAGAAVTVFPHDVDADTLAGYDGVAALERPRRPRAARRRGRDGARAARPRAGARHLPRPPAARARDRAARRSSCRSATAARTTRCVERATRPRARHEPEPRLRGRGRRRPARHARVALRRHRRGPRLPGAARALGAVPPRGRARARTTPGRSSSDWVEEVRLAAA